MAAKNGQADKVLAWLKKGRRCDVDIARREWGLTVRQYQRAIGTLKKWGHLIDSDQKAVKRESGTYYIASHQLIRK